MYETDKETHNSDFNQSNYSIFSQTNQQAKMYIHQVIDIYDIAEISIVKFSAGKHFAPITTGPLI